MFDLEAVASSISTLIAKVLFFEYLPELPASSGLELLKHFPTNDREGFGYQNISTQNLSPDAKFPAL